MIKITQHHSEQRIIQDQMMQEHLEWYALMNLMLFQRFFYNRYLNMVGLKKSTFL